MDTFAKKMADTDKAASQNEDLVCCESLPYAVMYNNPNLKTKSFWTSY